MLFDSIFKKIISMFILTLFTGFVITGAVLYSFLGNYASSQKKLLLGFAGDKVVELFDYLLPSLDDIFIQEVFRKNLELYAYNTDSIIWVINNKGIIVYAYSPDERLKIYEGKVLNEQQTRDVLQGNTKTEIGNFYGFFKESFLTIEKPIKYNNRIVGAVYLHTPVPEVGKLKKDVFNLFLISTLISLFIAMIFAYIFSRQITKPLKEITQASRIIAGGEFQKRLDIKSADEIGELAQSFNNMASALQNLEKMRKDFVANVSHELRTPMTSIRGFIQGILDGTIPRDRHEMYLNIVKDETERLNRLVNDLLDLAKMQAGEMQLNKRAFNINELLRRAIVKLENDIVRKSIEIEASFEEGDPDVFADMDSIDRVVLNLLHNAIKFTPEKGKIMISTSAVRDELYVSIEDTGVGIGADEINNIWERFYKSDKSRGMDKSGVGLGLAIVKNIINSHGERIWVQSEPGRGTRFTFTLPVQS